MMDQPSRHQCWIYSGAPSKQLHAIGMVLMERLNAGYRCMYMNSPSMVSGMRLYLDTLGVNLEQEIESGALLFSCDKSHLPDGEFEIEPMISMLKNTAHQAQVDGYVGLWASGDMTWEFGNEKNLKKLLEYECKLEELFQETPTLQGVCQYHMDTLPREIIQEALYVHKSVFINSTLSRLNPYSVPSDVLSVLCHHRPAPSDSKLQVMLERLGLPVHDHS